MAYHQNNTVDADRIKLGNWKIETAASAAATFVNLGAGGVTSWQHNIEKFTIQSPNAPDPVEGIGVESVTFGFDLQEWDASALSVLQNGLTSTSLLTSVLSAIYAGGNTTLTPRAYRLTNNTRTATGTSITVITMFKGVVDNGMTLVTKSDNDASPDNAYQFTVTCENDASLTVGSQLYQIVTTEV